MQGKEIRTLLALGMFDGSSGLTGRIEALLRHGRVFAADVSGARVAASAATLLALAAMFAISRPWIALAQPAPVFDVASVKIHKGGGGTTREMQPGSLRYLNITLGEFMRMAYGVKNYQIIGPDWAVKNASSDRYDIVAKAAGAGPEELHRMIGPLLADRFQLRFHRESRELPVFALIVLKGGPKFKEGDGGDFSVSYDSATGNMVYKNYPLEAFAGLLSNLPAVSRPVLDKTGLPSKYTFSVNLNNVPAGLAIGDVKKASVSTDPVDSPVFTNIQEQLGLKLEAQKATIDVIVIDHVEKIPAEN
jgi:uncharacterized protein (TIGR03435 family)